MEVPSSVLVYLQLPKTVSGKEHLIKSLKWMNKLINQCVDATLWTLGHAGWGVPTLPNFPELREAQARVPKGGTKLERCWLEFLTQACSLSALSKSLIPIVERITKTNIFSIPRLQNGRTLLFKKFLTSSSVLGWQNAPVCTMQWFHPLTPAEGSSADMKQLLGYSLAFWPCSDPGRAAACPLGLPCSPKLGQAAKTLEGDEATPCPPPPPL